MEHLWSPAGATGGNRWQMADPRKPLKQAYPQPVATHGNRFGAHGKEGVDGSSPSEGSAKAPHVGAFLVQVDLLNVDHAVGMELWMEPSTKEIDPAPLRRVGRRTATQGRAGYAAYFS
jgi:hypothetical protein